MALALEHHIIDFKKGARGTITQVKHIKMGWMTIEAYYDWCKGRDLLYTIGPEVVKGGYKINAAIYGLEVEIAGFSIPVGPAIVVATIGAAIGAAQAGDYKTAATLLAALVLPFGSLLLLYMWVNALKDPDAPPLTGAGGFAPANLHELWDAVNYALFKGTGLKDRPLGPAESTPPPPD